MNAIGGYYLFYPRDYEQAKELDYLNEKALITPTWTTIVYSFFYINGNTQLAGCTTLYLIRTPSGTIKNHIESHTSRDYYEHSLDKFRAVLEIIFVMITCYYVYNIIKAIFFQYLEIIKPRYESQPEHIKKFWFYRLINFDRTSCNRNDTCNVVCQFFIKVVFLFFRTIFDIAHAMFNYFISNFF